MGEFYVQNEYYLAFAQLVLAMAGMGATLKPGDFAAVAAAPAGFLLGLLLQLIAVPLLAAALLYTLDLNPGVAVGIAIIAAVPGGTTSNIYTYFARGNIALSIAITAVTALVCLATVPIILDLLIGNYVPSDFRLPRGRIALEVLYTLLVPLAAGMLLLKFFPRIADPFSRWSIRISLAIIIVMAIGAGMSGRLNWAAFGFDNVLIVVGFVTLLLLLGFAAPKLFGFKVGDVVAINMEVVVRNVNLGLLIKASLFPATVVSLQGIGDNALFTLLLYATAMILLSIVLILLGRRSVPAGVR